MTDGQLAAEEVLSTLPEQSETAPPAGESLKPVRVGERLSSIDVLRGVALLGILLMNIYAFAMPFPAYANPTLYGGFEGSDFWTWVFTHIFAEQKFMAVFSMLFGAGIVLMMQRSEAKGVAMGKVFWRRELWLIAIGLCHAYFLWFGDILVAYGICGLLAYLFRRKSPRTLLIVAMVFLCVVPLVGFGASFGIEALMGEMAGLEERQASGESLSAEDEKKLSDWAEMQAFMAPGPEVVEELVATHRGGYLGILIHRVPLVLMLQTQAFLFFIFWKIMAQMLIGMALMKLDVLSARRSASFYGRLVTVGYGLGLPLSVWSAFAVLSHDFEPIYMMRVGNYFNYFGSVFVALGHIGVVMLVCRSGALPGLRGRLGAVGRMAFTNYLMHSVLLTTVFYGYGLGLFGNFGRTAQMGFVLAVWILQLWLSPIWLRRFRFGPAEWLWRSLTYRARQPMRLQVG